VNWVFLLRAGKRDSQGYSGPNQLFGSGEWSMVEPWSEQFAGRVREWCDKVARLGVDALVDAESVAKGKFERASGIIAEELFVRLCIVDYPPVPESLDRAPEGQKWTILDCPGGTSG
jgi:hypothetical protein